MLLGTVLFLIACTQGDRPSREEDIAAIERFFEAAGEAVSQGDVEAEINRFTDDGIYMWPDAQSIEGREQLRAHFEKRFALVDARLESKTDEIEVAGDWAFERGSSVAYIRLEGQAHVDTVYGKHINILRRQPDGSWKIARRIRNRNHPVGKR
jgi:uncharacterized protein (TIGR02246 family)